MAKSNDVIEGWHDKVRNTNVGRKGQYVSDDALFKHYGVGKGNYKWNDLTDTMKWKRIVEHLEKQLKVAKDQLSKHRKAEER